MAKITTDYLPNDIPAIKITLPGLDEEYLAMIDSGSAVTLYDWEIADKILHETNSACEMEVTGICGTNNSAGEWITSVVTAKDIDGKDVYLKLAGAKYDMSGINSYYSENYSIAADFAMLIGSDALSSIGAKIDYENKLLVINEKEGNKQSETEG